MKRTVFPNGDKISDPSYQNIKKFRRDFKNVPCLALTATATNQVVDEISIKLGLHQPQIFKQSFRRENLNMIVGNTSDKYSRILEFLNQILLPELFTQEPERKQKSSRIISKIIISKCGFFPRRNILNTEKTFRKNGLPVSFTFWFRPMLLGWELIKIMYGS